MISGYVWLGTAGLLLLLAPPGTVAFSYDAAVHAIAIGFIFSMIFGHPAGRYGAARWIQFSGFVYGPLALLHLSVLLRVSADLLTWIDLRVSADQIGYLLFRSQH